MAKKKRKSNAGRPRKCSETAARRKILDVISKGGTFEDAAAMVGASHDALWAERRRDPAFDAKVREAMVKQKLSWIKNAGEKKPDWMLSMRCPGEYGRKDRYSLEQFAAFVDRVCDKILPEIPEERREIVRSKIEAELTHEAIKGGVIPDDSNGT